MGKPSRKSIEEKRAANNAKYRAYYAKNAEKERLRNKVNREKYRERIRAYQTTWWKKKALKLKLKRQAKKVMDLIRKLRQEQILLIRLCSDASNMPNFHAKK
jgi:hypothetical protein